MLKFGACLSLLAATSVLAYNPQAPFGGKPARRYSDVLKAQGQFHAAADYDPANHPTFSMGEGPKRPQWELDDPYYGIKTMFFNPVPPTKCLAKGDETPFDVAVIGAPFDTATSYRPGARFGPNGIRQGSAMVGGYNRVMKVDPFEVFNVVDCGDVPMSKFNNHVALDQLEDAYIHLLNKTTIDKKLSSTISKDGEAHPRMLTLGGDHTIVLPILRALEPVYGPITVIHFDSHLDTWPDIGDDSHGTYFAKAYNEGLITDKNIHVGIKNSMWNHTHHNEDGDDAMGWSRVYAEEIDKIGVDGVVKSILDRVGKNPVYITLDIDVVDPSYAPATGTPATGGYTPREIIRIIQGLAGLRVIGADVVEVAPAYDNVGETTSILAASIAYEFLSIMALTPS